MQRGDRLVLRLRNGRDPGSRAPESVLRTCGGPLTSGMDGGRSPETLSFSDFPPDRHCPETDRPPASPCLL